MIQNGGNTKEEFGVYALLSEYLIYISTVAIQFACKPRHRTFLNAEFLFDAFSDVYHNKNQAEPSSTYFHLRYGQAPCT